jgi:hypothetical protein
MGAGGYFVWLQTPDPGWLVEIDRLPVAARSVTGIIQTFPLSAGPHCVTARYRPPGLPAGLIVSLVSTVALVRTVWTRSRRGSGRAGIDAGGAKSTC